MVNVSQAKARAIEIRNQLGLGQRPVADIFALLEEVGIILFLKPFINSSLSAIFMQDKKNYLVVINTNRTLGHQIFSAAHELSHYFYDKEMLGGMCSINKRNPKLENENLADEFASHFLMPDDGIISIAEKRKNKDGNLDIYDIIFIQQYFRVSWIAMLKKLKYLGYINNIEDFRNIGIIELIKMFNYDLRLVQRTMDKYVSKKYIELTYKCLENDEISFSKAQEYLNHIGVFLSESYLTNVNKTGGEEFED